MSNLLIRNLDNDVQSKLQIRAYRNNRSVAEEAREILRNALRDEAATAAPVAPEVGVQSPGSADFERKAPASLGRKAVLMAAPLEGVDLPWNARE
jgi:plasmid stability protein